VDRADRPDRLQPPESELLVFVTGVARVTMGMRARAVILGIVVQLPAPSAIGLEQPAKPTFVEYLRAGAVPRGVIEGFLRGPSWARFDSELGYVLGNSFSTDGIDGSATISTARPDGARTAFIYVGRSCRINTYGDSFTRHGRWIRCGGESDDTTRRSWITWPPRGTTSST
jgi:hypothetical protein